MVTDLESAYPLITVISSTLIIMSLLVSVAFFTSVERKILSYIQARKGPNKPSLMGILQPFADAVKLFNKTLFFPTPANKIMAMTSSSVIFLLSILTWPLIPFFSNPIDANLNILAILVVSSLSVYTSIMIGWSTHSKYSHLGSIRNSAQLISYEINFFMIIINFMLLSHSFNLSALLPPQTVPFILGLSPVLLLWMLICLAEVNRSPFDFAEAESELVSGFNVEFMGGFFALIFLAEYSNMLILSTISLFLFNPNFIMMSPMLALSMLWARGTLPRLRYDILMTVNWKLIMPLCLSFLFPFTLFSFTAF